MKKPIFLYLLTPFLLQWGISYAIQFLLISFLGDISAYAAELTVVIALLIIPIAWYIYKKDSAEMQWQEEEKLSVKSKIRIGMLGVSSCISLNAILLFLRVQEVSGSYQNVAETIYQSPIWVQFLGMGIAAPMMEELLYRGILYRRLRSYISNILAITLSALVFGVMHGNLVQFLFATGLGVLLALVYERYKKISAAFLLHIVVNITSLSMTWLGGFERIISGDWIWLLTLALIGLTVCTWEMLQKC